MIESILRRQDVYDALGYSEPISNQAKIMVSSSPASEGKYDYSKDRRKVYAIFICNTKILLGLSMKKRTRKDMLRLEIEPMTRTGLHDQCCNHSTIEAQSSHIVFFSE